MPAPSLPPSLLGSLPQPLAHCSVPPLLWTVCLLSHGHSLSKLPPWACMVSTVCSLRLLSPKANSHLLLEGSLRCSFSAPHHLTKIPQASGFHPGLGEWLWDPQAAGQPSPHDAHIFLSLASAPSHLGTLLAEVSLFSPFSFLDTVQGLLLIHPPGLWG